MLSLEATEKYNGALLYLNNNKAFINATVKLNKVQ